MTRASHTASLSINLRFGGAIEARWESLDHARADRGRKSDTEPAFMPAMRIGCRRECLTVQDTVRPERASEAPHLGLNYRLIVAPRKPIPHRTRSCR